MIPWCARFFFSLTISALAHHVAARWDEAVVNFVMIGIEHEALAFLQNFSHRAALHALREFFVEREASVIPVNGDEYFGVDELDEELQFPLIAVS